MQRDEEVVIDIPESFVIADGDDLYVCGTVDAFNRFYEEFAVTFETS